MFIVIFTTSLLTFFVLVISSVSYLISLICEESDDTGSSNSLAIDTHDFSTTPTMSPINNLLDRNQSACLNSDHHHLCNEIELNDLIHAKSLPRAESSLSESNLTTPVLGDDSAPSTQEHIVSNNQPPQQTEIAAQISSRSNTPISNNLIWTTSPISQKNYITNQLGLSTSKQVFDDFDTREMQLGGTGLHWCKSRKSLDKLIQLGVPLDAINSRQETAMHVAIRKRKLQVLIGLLCNGAKLECLNEQGDTPLLTACKSNDIFACQILIVFDADYDVTDHNGYSARHHVATICERHRVKQSQPQPQLPSASHLILAMLHEIGAKRCPRSHSHEFNIENNSSKQYSQCTEGCSACGSYNGNSYNRWPNFRKESLYKRHMFLDMVDSQQKRLRKRNDSDEQIDDNVADDAQRKSRLLCIDGGGMRGVITCQILIEIQKYLRKPILSYFDWLGGTSVGAYLCCALSVGTTLSALRRNCFDVKDEVFCGNKPYNSKYLERVLKRTYGASTRMSDAKIRRLAVTTVLADRDPCQLRFFRNYRSPADLLEMYGYSSEWFNGLSNHSNPLRSQISSQSKSSSSLTARIVSSKSTQISAASSSLTNGSSSKSSSKRSVLKAANQAMLNKSATIQQDVPSDQEIASSESKNDPSIDTVIDEDEQDPLMWQAVRASAAAPFFFKPYGPYLDGGIISNNPTMDMLTEFFSNQKVYSFLRAREADKKLDKKERIHPLVPIEPPRKLDLVISLGTGRSRVIGRQSMFDFGNVASGFATVFSPVELLRSLRAARDLFKKLMQQSCQTEDHILDRAQAWCASMNVPYFRINPPLASVFSIDDKRDEQLVNALWQTKLYMGAVKDQLKQLGALLDGPCSGQEQNDSIISTNNDVTNKD